LASTTADQPGISGRISELDGLRGVAVLLVVAYHAVLFNPSLEKILPAMTPYGHAGVDLFFVLSGFLITGILLHTKGRPVYFRNFYAKRALRIWPLYYLLLFITFVIVPLLARYAHLATGENEILQGKSGPVYLLLLQNWFYRLDNGPTLLSMTWSLAIEEQFYIVWPALVALCKPKKLVYILGAIVLLSPAFRLWASLHGFTADELYRMTWFRLDGLSLGALIVLWTRSDSFSPRSASRVGLAALAIGVASFFTAPVWALDTLISFGCAGLLLLALWSSMTAAPAGAFFRFAGLRYIGQVSYCLYLVHQPMYYALAGITKAHIGQHHTMVNVAVMIVGFAASLAVASISWYLFESPILTLKDRLGTRDETKILPSQPLIEVPAHPAPEPLKARAARQR
jgi:peptidoglycan/LPS O-acetylase OafA/YrhL